MKRAWSSSVPLVAAAACALVAAAVPSDAEACGGVFVQAVETPGSRTIVRDHRMAIAIGRDRTVIWDEVRLQGDPRDFVWITPIRQGTTIELADDEWLSALDVSTQPVVYGPRHDSRGGCALAGCAGDENVGTEPPAGSVFVVKEEVLGPYDSVTVRAAGDPDAPYRWLLANGYRIDDEKVRAILATYAQEGFDFAALKLHATCNQTAMQPVRIVVPGADPRILIRMALAGARTDLVPITLFVLGEAPYRPASYPFGLFDDDDLEWDRSRSSSSSSSSSSQATYAPRSNYDEIANRVMAREGRTWLVESVGLARLAGDSAPGPTPGLHEAYDALCSGKSPENTSERSGHAPGSTTASPTVKPPCKPLADAGADAEGGADEDAGVDPDAGDDGGDAGGDAGGAGDGGVDASVDASVDAGDDAASTSPDDAGKTPEAVAPPRCLAAPNDDYTLATRDVIGTSRIYVTRLRARIQPTALQDDLTLTPATGDDTRDISNLHQVARYEDEDERPSKRSCAATSTRRDRAPAATWALGAAAALVLTAWLRRKRR